ncbi:MAG: response regulator [Planctomycetaceae bacterium]|nr:response regulator [Planctomycetaceae bacterium]
MQRKAMYTTGELARYCGVSFRTVLRWIERGTLRAHKLPGRGDHRVKVEDFLEFLALHEMPIPAELRAPKMAPRVLIVEDEHHMARAIERPLQRAGFETKHAADGFRAGTLLGTWRPHVVTLDLRIPGLSGYDVLAFLRGTSDLDQVRILVLSALSDRELHDALRLGADRALAKPFENEQLVSVVAHLAESNAGSRSEPVTPGTQP